MARFLAIAADQNGKIQAGTVSQAARDNLAYGRGEEIADQMEGVSALLCMLELPDDQGFSPHLIDVSAAEEVTVKTLDI